MGVSLGEVHARLQSLPNPCIGGMRERIVVHHQNHPEAVEDFISAVQSMAQGKVKVEPVESYSEEGQLRKEMALGY